jgi:hypothetical protein
MVQIGTAQQMSMDLQYERIYEMEVIISPVIGRFSLQQSEPADRTAYTKNSHHTTPSRNNNSQDGPLEQMQGITTVAQQRHADGLLWLTEISA